MVPVTFKGFLFGPLEFSRRDLMAINIQRGRDHGLPDYNTARKEYNLSEITNFTDINSQLFAEKPDVSLISSCFKNNVHWKLKNKNKHIIAIEKSNKVT